MDAMTAPPASAPVESLRAVLFDAYGTLFDVYSIGLAAERLFPGAGERIGILWRDKQIEYTRLSSMSGRMRSFRDCTRAGLRFATRRLGLSLGGAAEDELMSCYDRLEPFAENRAVLEELKRRGIRAGILSNGDPDMLDAVVGHAGFTSLLDPLLSVEGTGRFKTDPATYALGTAAFGLVAPEVTWFGYTTLWINRFGLPLDELGAAPTRTGTNLADVLAFPFASPPLAPERNIAP
jgi:2-haloacid dehalogenase